MIRHSKLKPSLLFVIGYAVCIVPACGFRPSRSTPRTVFSSSAATLCCHRMTRSSSRSDQLQRTALAVLFGPGKGDDHYNDGPAAKYIPLDDLLEDHPITCDPDFPCDDDDNTKKYSNESLLVIGVPVVAPFLAYLSFEYIAKGYSYFTELLSSNNWIAVDGGAFQAKIIAPAINGLVVPAIALLFATLTSNTITTLRQRQVDVRRAINMEAGELRAIECLLDAIEAGTVQDQCRDYVSLGSR
jgi:Protein of unknown function (DUF4239)